jgi:endonuclease/exonuclease/phosphatase family metal-dependent hydrolase
MRYSWKRLLSSFTLESTKQGAMVCKSVLVGTFRPLELEEELPPEKRPAQLAVTIQHSEQSARRHLNVLSWNIWRSYNNEQILKELGELIKEYDLDIIFLQEAPVYEQSAFWQHELFQEYNVFYAPVHQPKKRSSYYNFEHTGNLTLIRSTILRSAVYELPTPTKDALGEQHYLKRICAYVQTSDGNKTIGLHNLHMENMSGEKGRLTQIKHLLKVMPADDVIILGGDLNTIFGNEACLKELEHAGFKRAIKDLRVLPRLDHFFVKGATFTGKPLKNKGSDHCPILTIVKI